MTLIPGKSRVSCFEQWHTMGLIPTVVLPSAVEEPPPYVMTPGELKIVRCLADCTTQAEISAELGCALGTVNRSLRRIYRKTGAKNMRCLTILAVRKGLITVEVEARPSWMDLGQRLPC